MMYGDMKLWYQTGYTRLTLQFTFTSCLFLSLLQLTKKFPQNVYTTCLLSYLNSVHSTLQFALQKPILYKTCIKAKEIMEDTGNVEKQKRKKKKQLCLDKPAITNLTSMIINEICALALLTSELKNYVLGFMHSNMVPYFVDIK